MKTRELISWAQKILLLAVFFYFVEAFDFLGLQFAQNHIRYAGIFFLLSLLNTTVLSIPIRRSWYGGWPLIGAVFLIFYALKYFLVALEAFYLGEVLSPEVALRLSVNGAIDSAILAILSVYLFGKMTHQPVNDPSDHRGNRPLWSWLWRILTTGVIYVALFIFAGQVVFRPLAYYLDPVSAREYIAAFNPENPILILLFQYLRGTIWALMTIPILILMRPPRWIVGLAIGLLYAVVMAPQILVPNDVLSQGLSLAHAAEVSVGNFVYGLIVTLLLARPTVPQARETSFLHKIRLKADY